MTLRWVEPTRGLVKIVRTARPFPHPPGTRLAPAVVAAIEGDWVEVIASDRAVDAPPALGGCYYTPLTSWGGSATVGHSAAYALLADPTDLRASRTGDGRVQLRWAWSPQAGQTLVVARPGEPPTGPDDPSARVETVERSEYERVGRYLLQLPPDGPDPWHVAVYALMTVDGQPVTSPGTESTARTVVSGVNPGVSVSYKFGRVGLRRTWSVTFRTEPPGAPVPPTVVVTHPRTVPLSADDGTVVASFEASRDGARRPLPAGLDLKRVGARVFADPRVEANGGPPVCFLHPEADAARV